MKSRIWVKLYMETLDDAKMGRLSDHLWRLAVELFLLAGRKGDDGLLPPMAEMAWTLRCTEEDLGKDLRELAEIGIVQEEEPGKWLVTNFSKRQAALSVEERVRYHRSGGEGVTYRYKDCNEGGGVTSTSTSSSESISSSDSASEGVDEEELPQTTLEAKVHPDVRIFCEVTGGRVPGLGQCRQIMAAVRYLRKKNNLDELALAAFLRPYWEAWSGRIRQDGRPYDRRNIVWLTEWAMNGTIPPGGKDAGEQRGKDISRRVDKWIGKEAGHGQ